MSFITLPYQIFNDMTCLRLAVPSQIAHPSLAAMMVHKTYFIRKRKVRAIVLCTEKQTGQIM